MPGKGGKGSDNETSPKSQMSANNPESESESEPNLSNTENSATESNLQGTRNPVPEPSSSGTENSESSSQKGKKLCKTCSAPIPTLFTFHGSSAIVDNNNETISEEEQASSSQSDDDSSIINKSHSTDYPQSSSKHNHYTISSRTNSTPMQVSDRNLSNANALIKKQANQISKQADQISKQVDQISKQSDQIEKLKKQLAECQFRLINAEDNLKYEESEKEHYKVKFAKTNKELNKASSQNIKLQKRISSLTSDVNSLSGINKSSSCVDSNSFDSPSLRRESGRGKSSSISRRVSFSSSSSTPIQANKCYKSPIPLSWLRDKDNADKFLNDLGWSIKEIIEPFKKALSSREFSSGTTRTTGNNLIFHVTEYCSTQPFDKGLSLFAVVINPFKTRENVTCDDLGLIALGTHSSNNEYTIKFGIDGTPEKIILADT